MINYYSKCFKNPTSPAGFVNDESFSYCRINIYFYLISAFAIVYLAIFIALINFSCFPIPICEISFRLLQNLKNANHFFFFLKKK